MTAVDAPRTTSLDWASTWWWFGARRLVRFVASLWVLVTFAFLMIHLTPGDPIRAALGPRASAAIVEGRRAELGLDDSILTQYLRYLGHLVTGDLGQSFQSRLPVGQIISDRLPHTLSLAAAAFAVILLVGIPVGLLAAIRTRNGRHRGSELTFTSASTLVSAVPDFLVAVVLVFSFAVSWDLLPIAGRSDASSYLIPVLALAVGPAAGVARIVRVEMLGVLGRDYIRTARAKRLPARLVYLRHALPNALTATLTVSGLLLSGLIAGTVLVETVMAWPGLGPTLTGSIINKDFPLAQGIVLVYGTLVLLVNLVVDLALAALDPRATVRGR
ncbi:ABC transporter permease [Nocardioides sp. cx-173]|uniref:ABC transporter permease n=1 Tax=Nocardioides sp. cx-173 TaxID=2898796 RepID=UPI001E409E86|nr:ABC transporter permease [Nocardioides sp. cx-173]MCD4524517.1 ABC transporter permease [Nocardioides sp. cx-173]UGB42998.1 ABC transporter permease [Nocardioides sp. cx-173]